MRRRTKLLLQRLIILAIIIGTAVAIVVFFKPRKQIQTTDGNNLSREYVRTIEAGKTINVVLPEPVAPIIPRVWPAPILNETSSRIVRSPIL